MTAMPMALNIFISFDYCPLPLVCGLTNSIQFTQFAKSVAVISNGKLTSSCAAPIAAFSD